MSPAARFLVALGMLAAVVAGGTLGYARIEGWPLGESLYMTVITVTTVGFAEVHPLSPAGRAFTIGLLALSLATLGYAVTVLLAFIFEGQFLRAVREREMRRRILRNKDHCIVCGGGDLAREIVREFQRARQRFVVIDRDPERSELVREEGVSFVAGDAGEDDVLEQAGIARARALIAALPDDQDNILVTLTARQMNPRLIIVARAADRDAARKLVKVGADRVISPTQIAGRRMASLVLRPSLVNYLDVMVEGRQIAMRIEEVRVAPRSTLVDRTLRDAGIGSHTGAVIIGIIGADGQARYNPSGTSSLSTVTLREGDILIALGSEEQLASLRQFMVHGPRNAA